MILQTYLISKLFFYPDFLLDSIYKKKYNTTYLYQKKNKIFFIEAIY